MVAGAARPPLQSCIDHKWTEGQRRTGAGKLPLPRASVNDPSPVSCLEQAHSNRSVLSAMLFALVAPPDRRHITDIPRFGDVATAEMIVPRTLRFE